jgi:lysine N6-hydroxylase
MKQLLKSILGRAGKLGLSQANLALAREFLDGHEFGLCLDTIVTLVCEEGTRIDEGFYREVVQAARKIGLESEKVEGLDCWFLRETFGKTGVELKHPFLYPVHKGFAEFLADGDLFAADEDLVVADGFEAGDVDDIGVVDAGEGCGGLFWFSFLQASGRMFRFGVQDNPFPLRREYNEYGKWVAGQLEGLWFGHRVVGVEHEDDKARYEVGVLDLKTGLQKTFHAKHLVIGIGSEPYWPECAKQFNGAPHIFHASDYLYHLSELDDKNRITIIGSGQSAAEIFQDTLTGSADQSLSWFTRSPRFFPMETSPAAFELSSPDYREHFYGLPAAMKEFILAGQDALYKGINSGLLSSIYEQLYERLLDNPADATALYPNCELVEIKIDSQEIICTFSHSDTQEAIEHRTDALVLATGYKGQPPAFLESIKERINYLPSGKLGIARNYAITTDQSIFIQNADLHTHGFASADLSFGPYRNAVILNTILGYPHFPLETGTSFQQFGGPKGG